LCGPPLSPQAAAGSKARTVGLALGSPSQGMPILSLISYYEIIKTINLLLTILGFVQKKCDAALQYRSPFREFVTDELSRFCAHTQLPALGEYPRQDQRTGVQRRLATPTRSLMNGGSRG
jgi:hypothetical protein